MGEAKRRRAEIEAIKQSEIAWRTGLRQDEGVIAGVAMRLHQRLVVERGFVGGCYQLAFFLRLFLKKTYDLDTHAVVGYVNDGTGPVMTSHAWIEFEGKKTDIALTRTEFPDAQLPGALIILDHVVRQGRVSYTYHRERSTAGLQAAQELSADWRVGPAIRHKEEEHRSMLARASDDSLIEAYFAMAPPGLDYAALARYASAGN